MDDAGESGASVQTPPRMKAEDNSWYLLATLYGVPKFDNHELRAKNRIVWNRYFAADPDEETRIKLIEEKRHPVEELRPFSSNELREVATAFAERSKASANKPALPASNADIDFSNVKIEQDVFFAGYRFSRAYFKGAAFSGRADFRDVTFFGGSFDGVTFSSRATFPGATFTGVARFAGAAFSGEAIFDGATFSSVAFFNRAAFSGSSASFDGATFFAWAYFSEATFSNGANFTGAAFSQWARFGGATYSGEAGFGSAAFSGKAAFDGATFSGQADFDGVIFSGHTDFGEATFREKSNFVNAEMKGETSFERAIFDKEPPRFFGAKLHQGTVWRGVKWPRLPKNKDEAGAFIDAYACLKLEMDRLKKHEDELKFFTLEMQSRRVELGTWRGLPFATYGVLSDYGRSYLRPPVALVMVTAIGTGAFWYFDARTSWEALSLSVANTLNVFGFRRDFNLAIDTPFACLKVFAAVQTIFGAILLFLFGLGIRNKFRMK